ncbi:MbtH family protein [Streptomyces sp. S186]|uniref:MbtH family protein n=1 Tax=Streptomyces sp. S186 TaxID=3434395 RepID=UPI003F674B17
MTADDRDPFDEYRVVRNDEDQYSLWPVARDLPAGWHETGTRGTREHCLEQVAELWTDMRPRSLREAMDGTANEAATA